MQRQVGNFAKWGSISTLCDEMLRTIRWMAAFFRVCVELAIANERLTVGVAPRG